MKDKTIFALLVAVTAAALLFLCVTVAHAAEAPAVALPDIAAQTSVTKPPVAEIQFDSWFLKTFVMRSTNETCNIRMYFVRYSYADKVMSEDPADTMQVEVENAYQEVAQFAQWQTAIGHFLGLVSNCAQKQEILNQIAAVDRQIETAKQADPDVDVTALEATRATHEASLAAVITALGPISP